jgi:hypothetical protein
VLEKPIQIEKNGKVQIISYLLLTNSLLFWKPPSKDKKKGYSYFSSNKDRVIRFGKLKDYVYPPLLSLSFSFSIVLIS